MEKNVQKSKKKGAKKAQKKRSSENPKKQAKVRVRTPRYIELKGFLSFFLLHELSRHSLSGDELAERVGSRKGIVLSAGTIYPALKRLRRQKLIAYKRDGRRKVYSLTLEGRRELKAVYAAIGSMFSGLRSKLKR